MTSLIGPLSSDLITTSGLSKDVRPGYGVLKTSFRRLCLLGFNCTWFLYLICGSCYPYFRKDDTTTNFFINHCSYIHDCKDYFFPLIVFFLPPSTSSKRKKIKNRLGFRMYPCLTGQTSLSQQFYLIQQYHQVLHRLVFSSE